MTLQFETIGVVGAGAMGRGIAQIAAQAGSAVQLFDMQSQAVAKARDEVFTQWDRMVEKGRMSG
ncbi:MAG: 3-hydroxyacyl-CoA dehydrogenase NAD-binding domain-containing protein, partial [Variovorax sp.]